MQVKRFFGPDTKSVLRQIREVLGEEAMILSNKQIDNGVEILCGMESAGEVDSYQSHSYDSEKKSNSRKEESVSWIEDPAISGMRRELNSLRGLLEDQLSGFVWKDLQVKKPVHATLIKRLMNLGFPLAVSKKMAMQVDELLDIETAWNEVQQKLVKAMPTLQFDLLNHAQIISLVGSSSSGKTSSIVKLAARYILGHNNNNVVVVTMDSQRIAGHEILKTYSRLLGFNVKVMEPSISLSSLLEQLSYAKLILIDTPSAINNRLYSMEQLKNAENNGYVLKKLLTISSLQQQKILQNQIEFFKNYQLDGCIITHIDEAISLGESLGIAIENNLPIVYTTNGEQVPEDIHIPDANTLIKKCWALGSQKESSFNKDSLAIRLLTEAVEL